ncbi:MAG: hypothetical protein AABX73_03055 [Nanoarchaeota archaeon]
MPNTDRNIAKLVRNSECFLFDYLRVQELSPGVIRSIADLYGTPIKSIGTKKGKWHVHERKGFSVPFFLEEERVEPSDRFCAVYERKGKPTTLFLGDLEERTIVDKTVEELSDKVLEQRRWFAWPPRKLVEENGKSYGTGKGFSFAVMVPSALLVDGVVSIMSGDNYQGVFNYLKSFKSSPLASGMIMMGSLAGMLASIELLGRFGEKMGPLADAKRVENLPQQALSFLYGQEAERFVFDENVTLQDELRKTELYGRLSSSGVNVSKHCFAEVHYMMQTVNENKVSALNNYLQQNKETIPLEKVVNVFSS